MNADNNTTNAINSITGQRDDYIANLRIPSSVLIQIRYALHVAAYCGDDRDVQIFNDIDEHLNGDYVISCSPLDKVEGDD